MKTLVRNFFLITLSLLLSATHVAAKNFRIMSFNVLVSSDVGSEKSWYNRSDAVCKFIKSQKPDVFGLQEPTQVHINDVLRHLPDYDFVGVARDDGKQGGEFSPVFYRKDRYKMLKSGTFWLSETPEEVSFGWDAACRRICSWAVLQDIKTGNSFIFANTHLDHIGKKARVNGALLIKERLSRIASNLPMMITGDFNVTDQEESYATMLGRYFPLVDGYKSAAKREGMHASWHNFGKIPDNEGNIIDFIFLTPNIKVKKAAIIDSSLGGGMFMSDHHPVVIDVDGKLL